MRDDPAVEAAQRAWEKNKVRSFHVQRVAAANEALKPIRELHRVPDDHKIACLHCHKPWPCDTAKLAYSESEL